VVSLLVEKPILGAAKAPPLPALAAPPQLATPYERSEALSGEIETTKDSGNAVTIYDGANGSQNASQNGKTNDSLVDNPIQRLREMIELRQDETVDILRQWLEQKEMMNS
jgi:flagellar M-ring protein FliF